MTASAHKAAAAQRVTCILETPLLSAQGSRPITPRRIGIWYWLTRLSYIAQNHGDRECAASDGPGAGTTCGRWRRWAADDTDWHDRSRDHSERGGIGRRRHARPAARPQCADD